MLLLLPVAVGAYLVLRPGSDQRHGPWPPEDDPFAPPPREAVAASDDPRRAAVAIEALTPVLREQLAANGLQFGDPVFIRIFKEERQLEVWLREPGKESYRIFRRYPIAAMSGKLGPKLAEGDGQAPEGFYSVTAASMNPASNYHLSFNLGFPNAYDRAHGRTGSFLMVHGDRRSIGCYAMTDPWIEEIYTLCDAAFQAGQQAIPVHCFPFRMTPERMAAAHDAPDLPFWENLREGYEKFEATTTPPAVRVRDGRYAFE